MNEQGSQPGEEPGAILSAPSTGNPAVDAVIEGLAALDDLPVADHVEVFAAAHESLRAALTDPQQT